MKIGEFRRALDDFPADEDVVWLDDEVWWNRLGALLDEVYAERARERRAQRAATRCPSWLDGCVVRCVRTQGHPGNHYNSTERWSDE